MQIMFEKVLSKGKIGKLELKNRFVVPSMGTGRAEYDGFLNENVIEYYVERARGGFGLIILEVTGIDPIGKAIPEEIMLDDDKYIPGLKKMVDLIHAEGAKVFPQLHHAGRQAMEIVVGAQPVAPSAVHCPMTRTMPRELTVEEIYELIEKYGDAAVRAKKAGFDGVELQCGHGYLVAQFLSGYSNKRADEFGGNFHKRTKFAVEILKKIKEKCGDDYPVCVRISANERVDGGLTPHESAAICKVLENAGADAIDVSTGVYGSMPWIIAPSFIPSGYELDDALQIKQAVNIPTIAVGRITDPYMAEHIVATGIADFVALGRASIADPYFPKKVEENRINEIAPCVGCMTRCQGVVVGQTGDRGITCMVNPFSAQENKRRIIPTTEKKKVVVVGGGPGGLQAAWVAAARGHDVVLLEKSGKLGGQFLPGSVPPGKQALLGAVSYYEEMCRKYDVEVKLNTEADAETILALKPDEVILATGAKPLECKVPISGLPVAQAIDVLEGGVPLGNNALVIGGGSVGIDVAEHLASQHRAVTIVEMLDEIGADLQATVKYFAVKSLNDTNVKVLTNTRVEEITADGVTCSVGEEKLVLKGFDMVVLAMGSSAYNPLEEKLANKVKSLRIIGDAIKPRKAVEAIEEATVAALEI